ncbi:MAG: PVC-type heme-binding CxxCH protein, partial [Myxococcota bacterium]
MILTAALLVLVAAVVASLTWGRARPGDHLSDHQAERQRLSVMFFGSPTSNGPHHDPITRYRVLKKGLGTRGIDLTYFEDPETAFTEERLEQFDAVLMYANWAQGEPMHQSPLVALLKWVEGGGGFVPVHCASACFGGSPLFVKLVGARFKTHGGEEFTVDNAVPDHPILRGLESYAAWDETYVHSDHGDDRTILQVRDGEPWSWTRSQGQGRVFYTASGHDHRVWDLPQFHARFGNPLEWVVGEGRLERLRDYKVPVLATEPVSLPGYRDKKEITEIQTPLTPEESMKLAQVPPGMTLSLFACEPDIVNPIHVAWDQRGRAYVVETFDYPNNLAEGNTGNDRITICEDTDGDGRADHFVRFAEGLSIPTSIVFVREGMLCTNGTELLYLADTDGDDRADVREVVFDGFSMGDTHAGVSNLRYGFDGWIWATIGYSGFEGTVGGEHHEFGQAVFRFRPDGSKLELLQNTTNNTWGLGFTEEGDVLGSTANANPSWYLTFARSAYERAGLDPPRTPRADDNPKFFPMSGDIRQVDQFDRYTSAASHAVYTARRFPEAYHNRAAFVCGPTGKLVGHFDLERTGAGFHAKHLPNNLYGSADGWSAPVCVEVGPDGAVWICDWYNIVVQHNPTPNLRASGIDAETGKGNAYVTPHRDKERGRIYRVFPTGSKDDVVPNLDPNNPVGLVAGLGHSNLFWRLQSQRLLVERGAVDVVPLLVGAVGCADVSSPHALRVLSQLGVLEPRVIEQALRSTRPALRRAAIALADPQQLKSVFVGEDGIRADGRELGEVLVGLSRGAADPAIGAAVFAVGQRLGDELLGERALGDAWKIASRRQRQGVLAAAAASGLSFDVSEDAVNLLPNPGFEEVEGHVPVGWGDLRMYRGERDEVELESSSGGRDGSLCLRLAAANRTDCGAAASVQL